MRFPSWLRTPGPVSRPPVGRHRPKSRLTLESLEDRCVPATGTSATLVADILPGAESSYPQNLTNVNGTLYFNANRSVWKSDGTAAGTVFLKEFPVLPTESTVFTPVNGTVLFNDQVGYGGLWRTDGTPAGTVLVKAVGVWSQPNPSNRMPVVGGRAFFEGEGSGSGAELWVSDGTSAGTVLVKDIYGGSTTVSETSHGHTSKYKVVNSSAPQWLTSLNDTLVFTARDGTNGRELWTSDGTAKGTKLIKDIAPGHADSDPQYLTVFGGAVYFGAAGGLWKSDGTAAGTVQVRAVGGTPRDLTDVNGTLFFCAGGALWKSDGTPSGTTQVVSGSVAGDPQALAAVNGTLFFYAVGTGSGRELWKSDGTTSGTVLVKDIYAGPGSSTPGGPITNVNYTG